MGSAFLAFQLFIVFGAGQAAAQAGAANLKVVALVNGVGLVQNRVDGAGNRLAGVRVQRLVAVDQDAQEPVRAFFLKADIPQAQAETFDRGADKCFHNGCGTAGLMVFAFGHKKSPYHKKKADL